jgi:hypothetical protein
MSTEAVPGTVRGAVAAWGSRVGGGVIARAGSAGLLGGSGVRGEVAHVH